MPWKNALAKETNYYHVLFFLLLTTLLSLAFNIRIVNSISIILLVAVTLMHPARTTLLKNAFSNPYFLSFLALFLLKIAGVFYTSDVEQGWKHVTGKAALIAIPFFFCANKDLPALLVRRLMTFFSLSLLGVTLYCLVHAAFLYQHQHDVSVFFYHPLVSPFHHHAILFSFDIFFCIVYWMEDGLTIISKQRDRIWIVCLLIYFSGIIFLLSSKLAIVILLIYLAFYFTKNIFTRSKWVLPVMGSCLLAVIVLIGITNNPVKKRFSDLTNGSAALYKQPQFSPGVYFNGLQLRLLTWRFTNEILTEKKAWLLGVSPGDAQPELNKKYTDTHMYLGDGVTNKGYLDTSCHNTFLQITLESGLAGLLILLFAFGYFLYQSIKRRRRSTILFFTAILAFCFTDSLLSTQYAILLVVFFPLLSLYTKTTAPQ